MIDITGANVKRAFVFSACEAILRHYIRLKSGIQVLKAES